MGIFRLILALIVVVGHIDLESSRWGRFENYTFTSILNLSGVDAVHIFFLISGFVIPLTFSKNYQNSNESINIRNYYLNRALRIYPLYFLSLLLAYIDSFYFNIINLPEDNLFLKEDILKNIFILFHEKGSYINSVSWTLDFELRWYLAVPLIFYIKNLWNKNKKLNILIILTITLYLFIELIYLYYAKYNSLQNYEFYLGKYILYFISGYLVFEFFINLNIKTNKNYFFYGVIFIFIAFIFPDTPTVIFFLISIYLCFTIKYDNKFDKICGDLSYPVYILHMPVIIPIYLQVNKYIGYFYTVEYLNYFLVYVVTILLFLFICYFLLIFIDYPINRLRMKFKN